jgi:hypothetical protein
VRKEFSPFRFAACALCLLSLFALRAYAQDKDQKKDHPNGIVQDWSRRHLAYPRFGSIQSLIALEKDPRAILSWQEAEREDWHRAKDRDGEKDGDRDGDKNGGHRHSHGASSDLHTDWSISLGSGTTAPAMYPAKYTFDINATPSCSTDFIVYPVNATGSGTQPNIVGFNNLYSGSTAVTGGVTSGSTGVSVTAGIITPSDVGRQITGADIPANDTIASISGDPATSFMLATPATGTNPAEPLTVDIGMCNRTPTGSDTGIAATAFWSYNIQGIAGGGEVATSPSLSIDGTKIAFVETVTGITPQAHFHVLAWKNGDGVDATNLQNVLLPVSISSFTDPLAPAAASGTASDLILGSTSDTLSSPFVDYVNDVAYVGNDSGTLFRIKDVFCPALSACASGGTPAPGLDTTWPTSGGTALTGTLSVCSGKLTGPITGGAAGNIFVGCSDGKLYGFTSAGVALATPSVTVGDGSAATGGVVDPPLMDVVNGFVYAVSGTSGVGGVTGSILVQAAADFSSQVSAALGQAGRFNLHAPAFNNAYFTSPTSSNWLIYEWALNVGGTQDAIYGAGFDGSHNMTLVSGAPANSFTFFSTPAEFSPLTEILNGSTDQLYATGLTTSLPNLLEYNLTDFVNLFPNVEFPFNFPSGAAASNAAGASVGEGSGTSAIVVDNVSSSAQASSIYFGVPSLNTAVKLTQSGLQ